jgi:hypothetical protein
MLAIIVDMGDHFQFGSVFIKKQVTKPKFKKKTKTEPKPVQTDRFRFRLVRFGSFFWTKTGSNRFGLVFFRSGSVFFGFGSVRFGFLDFRVIKPKPNWSVFSKF